MRKKILNSVVALAALALAGGAILLAAIAGHALSGMRQPPIGLV